MSNKTNIMTTVYVAKLGFKIYSTTVKVQIIDNLFLKTYKMVIISVQVLDKLNKAYFF